MPNCIVLIDEWDGDRSSAAGGFGIKVKIGTREFTSTEHSFTYDSNRAHMLKEARNKAAEIAKEIGAEVVEEIFGKNEN